MELSEMLLRKEELPILNGSCFQIPIHPKLLLESAGLDETLASEVFPEAAEEWYEDLQSYARTMPEGEIKEWIIKVFLKKKSRIIKHGQNLCLKGWIDDVLNEPNGFASSISIRRNAGGSLFFDKNASQCKIHIAYNSKHRYIRFSEAKLKEFCFEQDSDNKPRSGRRLYVYAPHNIDFYPGALFLRNWAILYENEALKQILN